MISIKSYIEFSMLDWPGKLAAVVFLPRCNFRCPYCHNHSLVLEPDLMEDISPDEVLKRCEERSQWIDGVVVSGGEPTIHPWLPDLLRWIKANDLDVKLDTNGYFPEVLKRVMEDGLVDHIAMDIKAPLEKASYSLLAGVPVDINKIRSSIDLIIFSGISHTFRTTVIPQWHTEEDLLKIASILNGSSGLTLQNLKPADTMDPNLRSLKHLPEEDLRRLNTLVNERIIPRISI